MSHGIAPIVVDRLERRRLMSAITPADSLVFLNQPANLTVDGYGDGRVVMQLVNATGRPDRAAAGHKVSLSIASGSGTGAIVASTRMLGSKAIFRNIAIHQLGDYTVRASVDGLASTVSSPFAVSPGRARRIALSGVDGGIDSGIVEFSATLFDQFGNVAIGDHSVISLWKNRDKFIGIYAISSKAVYDKKGVLTGVRVENGTASFEVIAVLGPRKISVVFADSSRLVKRVRSIEWDAKA